MLLRHGHWSLSQMQETEASKRGEASEPKQLELPFEGWSFAPNLPQLIDVASIDPIRELESEQEGKADK